MVLICMRLTGGGLFGFDISSMSGVLGTNAYKNYFGHPIGSQVRGRLSRVYGFGAENPSSKEASPPPCLQDR